LPALSGNALTEQRWTELSKIGPLTKRQNVKGY